MAKLEGIELINWAATRAYSHMLFTNTMLIGTRDHSLFYLMFGLHGRAKIEPTGVFKADTLEMTDFDEMEIPLSDSLPGLDTVADEHEEVALVTGTYEDRTAGSFKRTLTHFNKHIIIPKSHVDRVGKSVQKAEATLDFHAKRHTEGAWENIAERLWGNTDQTRTSLLGLPFLISASTNYGLDRSLEANANWRPYTNASSGAFDLATIATAQREASARQGNSELIMAGASAFDWARQELEATVHAIQHPNWVKFGGSHLQYGNSVIAYERHATTNAMYGLDGRYLKCVKKRGIDFSGDFQVARWRRNAYESIVDFSMGFGSNRANAFFYLGGFTAPA